MQSPMEPPVGAPPAGPRTPKGAPSKKKGVPEKYYRPSKKAWEDERNKKSFDFLNEMLENKLEVHTGKPNRKDPVAKKPAYRPSRKAWEMADNEEAFEFLNDKLKVKLNPQD